MLDNNELYDVCKGFFAMLKSFYGALTRTAGHVSVALGNVFRGHALDETAVEALQEHLISADVGPALAVRWAEDLRTCRTSEHARTVLRQKMLDLLQPLARPFHPDPVVFLVGVNAAGKTTTVGKLLHRWLEEKRSVCVVAADTFRVAAIPQLAAWVQRAQSQKHALPTHTQTAQDGHCARTPHTLAGSLDQNLLGQPSLYQHRQNTRQEWERPCAIKIPGINCGAIVETETAVPVGKGDESGFDRLSRGHTDAEASLSLMEGQIQWVEGSLGSDPASVVHQGLRQADADVILIDTAGRLPHNVGLMAELAKMRRVVKKVRPGVACQTILVLDASCGQHALTQVELFAKAVPLNGLIMTKLDGSAWGGTLLTLAYQFGLPIYGIGMGEGIQDFVDFDARSFVEALVPLA